MSAGPMNTIIAGFIGLLVIVAIVILGPVLAGSIDEAKPALAVDSDWNSTHNTELPTGVSVWQQNVTIGGIVIQESESGNLVNSEPGFNSVKSFSSSPWRSTTSVSLHNGNAG